MKVYDAHMQFGPRATLPGGPAADLPAVQAALDKYGLQRALLVALQSVELDFRSGNEAVFAAARRDARLVPCPTVVPNSDGEVGQEERFVRELVRRGARAVGFYPEIFHVSLEPRVIGRLFRALGRRRLPVLMPQINAALAAAYPSVPFIAIAPAYRARGWLAALRDLPNLHLGVGGRFAMNAGLETLWRRCRPSQLLLATNFPVSEPGAALAYLCYAELDAAARARIAWRNLDALLRGVRHD